MPLAFDQNHNFFNTFMHLHTYSDEFRVEGSLQLVKASFFIYSTVDLSFYLLKFEFSIFDYFRSRQSQYGFEVVHLMVIDCTYELTFNEQFDTIKSGGKIMSNKNPQSQCSQIGQRAGTQHCISTNRSMLKDFKWCHWWEISVICIFYFLYIFCIFCRNWMHHQSLLASVDKNMAKDFKHVLYWLPVWDPLSCSQSLYHLQSY